MSRIPVFASILTLVLAGIIGAGRGTWSRSTVAEEGASAGGHPLVGSWLVAVTVDGQPPLELSNLASFTADGVALVSAPPLLPELPGAGAPRELFSGGHGAWTATGPDGAAVEFVFLVVDEEGNPRSVNTVRGELVVAAGGDAYEGEFVLTIVGSAGHAASTATGRWRATRIGVGAEMVATPAAVLGAVAG